MLLGTVLYKLFMFVCIREYVMCSINVFGYIYTYTGIYIIYIYKFVILYMSIRGKVVCLEIYVWTSACICMTVYVKLHTCVYLNTSAHMYKSIYLCICRYIVTYMSVDIYNYVTDNVFYSPIEVYFCSLLFQTTDISCDGRGTSDLVSVPHFQL